MSQNTYPDGFPLTPLESIDFSYTFSNEEKNEWREWVKTATAEQQQELVDTLHSIWIENLKEVVPNGFVKTENVINEDVTELVQPKINNENKELVSQVPLNNPKLASSELQKPIYSEKIKQEARPIVPMEPIKKEFVFNEKSNLQGSQDTKSNEKTITQSLPQVQRNQQSNQNNNRSQNITQQTNSHKLEQKGELTEEKKEMSFFDFARVRESSTRNQLEKLQKEFIIARQKKYEVEQMYTSQISKLSNELDQKQQILFDKVVQITLGFENVADYLQSMTEKLLKTNESNIILEQKVRSLEILLDEKIKNLSYDKENTQYDIDRLFRESREVRENLRGEILDIKRTSSVSTVDSFGSDGLKIKLDILSNKLAILEGNIRNQTNQNKQQIQTSKPNTKELLSDKKNENAKVVPEIISHDGVLDISDIV